MDTVKCHKCNGTGEYYVLEDDDLAEPGLMRHFNAITCPECNGKHYLLIDKKKLNKVK